MSLVTPRSRLAELSVHRPVSTVMLMLGVMVVGAIALWRIKVEQWPSGATFPFLYVRAVTVGEGSTPRELERELTIPLENAIRTTAGLRSVRGRTSSRAAFFWLEYDNGTDMNVAYLDLKARIERIQGTLPEEVDDVTIGRISTDDEPTTVIAVGWPAAVEGEDVFYPIEHTIAQELSYVDGVASVEVDGLLERSVRILVDRDRAAALGVNLYSLVQALRRSNADLESGDLVEGELHLFLRSMGRWRTLEEVAEFPVGRGLRVKDLAQVREVYSVARSISKLNGQHAARLAIYKDAGANSVAVGQALHAAVAALQEDPRLAGYTFIPLYSEGEEITKNLRNLERTLGLGSILAFLVLLVFLRRLLMTLTICLAIPTAMLMGLVAIYFSGSTLNVLTLMGFTLAAGMLVDNSVVVVESIFARREAGEPPRVAAVAGPAEVGLAILLATMTSIAVYLPSILLVDNDFMRLMLENIGWPVCYALAASLVVALLFIPLATLPAAPPRGTRRTLVALTGAGYQRLLGAALDRRSNVLILLALLAVAAWMGNQRLERTDRNQGGEDRLSIFVELPASYDLARAEQLIDSYTETLMEHRAELGFTSVQSRIHTGMSRIRLYLEEPLRDEREKDALFQRILELLPETTGVDLRTTWQRTEGFDYESGLSIQLQGPDTDRLIEIADEVARRLEAIPGLVGVTTDAETGPDELRVHIDRQLAGSLGVDPRIVLGTMQYALRGQSLPPFRPGERETRMFIEYDEDYTVGLGALRNIPLWLPRSDLQVPLATIIGQIQPGKGLGSIQRQDGLSSISVGAALQGDNLAAVRRQVDQVLQDLHLPRGYRWATGGRFMRFEEDFFSLQMALLLSAACVFILMAVLFESLVLPLSVFASVFMAFPGVVLFLYLSGTAFDNVVMFGCIILVGIVVNNAIVLVDRINRVRREGVPRREAIIQAGRDRYRPILMTALTTIVGLIPMAFGDSGTGIPYAPLGKTVMGGMFTSTLLTLIAVPVFYTIFDDLGVWCRGRLAGSPAGTTGTHRGCSRCEGGV